MTRFTPRRIGVIASIVACLMLAACGSGTKTAESSTPGQTSTAVSEKVSESSSMDTGSSTGASASAVSSQASGSAGNAAGAATAEAAKAKLPQAIKDAGVLKVATSSTWPPFAYKDANNKVVGLDVDVVSRLAEILGLKADFADLEFSNIIPGVGTGRYDVGVNEMADTQTRRAQVQFVDYYQSGLAMLVKKGTTGVDPNNLCGIQLAVTQGSSQQELAEKISAKCKSDGKPEIDFVILPETGATILAVSAGRAKAFMTDNAVGAYLSTTSNKDLEVLPGLVPDSTQLTGIMVNKTNTDLAQALAIALDVAIADGSYQKILAKYNAQDSKVDKATINGEPYTP